MKLSDQYLKRNGIKGDAMQSISVPIHMDQIILAIKSLEKDQQEEFIEDLVASLNSEYIKSIKEAREDYKAGRVYTHEDVFGEK